MGKQEDPERIGKGVKGVKKMKEIILTGYTKEQFRKIVKKEERGGCYLCKRRIDDEGVFFIKEGDEVDIGSTELDTEWFEVIEDSQIFKFPLCSECHMLLKAFVEKLLFQKEFGF